MPTRFDRYRMRDGETPLSEAYFNPVLQDLDVRLASLEDLRLSWEAAVRTITDFGLARINSALVDSMAVIGTATQEAAAITDKRVAAEVALASLATIIDGIEIGTQADLALWKADRLAELDAWRASLTAELPGIDSRLEALEAGQTGLTGGQTALAASQASLFADLNTVRALALAGL